MCNDIRMRDRASLIVKLIKLYFKIAIICIYLPT